MISLLKKYHRLLAWFISGLVLAVLLSLGITNQKPANAFAPFPNQDGAAAYSISDFAATHLEPNFYQ